MNPLIEAFKEALLEKGTETLCESIEIVVDNISKTDIVKNLPVANQLAAVGKAIQGLYNIKLFNQTNNFIITFNNQTISEENLIKYREKINKDEKKKEEELGRVLIILNEMIDDEKSKLLAKFYVAYINEEISWDRFCEFADVLNRIFISDLATVYEIYKSEEDKPITITTYEKYRVDRLISTGLLSLYSKPITVGEINGGPRQTFEKNGFGELFVKIAKK